jgi:hypothetical protein
MFQLLISLIGAIVPICVQHRPINATHGAGKEETRCAPACHRKGDSSMAPVACPKCSVVVYETASGGWRFDPPTGCVDLEGTEWGAKGEFEWCPTLAVAMPDEVFWPGQSHRDHVMQVAEQGKLEKKRKRNLKKDSAT